MSNEAQVVDSETEELTVTNDDANNRIHPWRICPIGKHYVITHPEKIPPSKKHADGEVIKRRGHCAKNPPHKDPSKQERPTKDILSFEELRVIAEEHFGDLKELPKPNTLGFEGGNEFDRHIGGWVLYWNKVFDAKDPLDPNLVKALIASESSFKPKKNIPTTNGTGFAHGLMQLTDDTLNRINGHKVELRDHFVHVTTDEAMVPTANICAGVRWLFMKYAGARERIAKRKLNRPATWEDAVAEYKGVLDDLLDGGHPAAEKEARIFRDLYQKLLES